MTMENIRTYLLDGCNSWEELKEKEVAKASKMASKYLNEYSQATDTHEKEQYPKIAGLYQEALESPVYSQASAVNTARQRIQDILGEQPLNTVIWNSNIKRTGEDNGKKFTDYFVNTFGSEFVSNDELTNMTYEGLRKKLYDEIGLEYVPLENAEEVGMLKSGVDFTNGYPTVSSLSMGQVSDLEKLIEGQNISYSGEKERTM